MTNEEYIQRRLKASPAYAAGACCFLHDGGHLHPTDRAMLGKLVEYIKEGSAKKAQVQFVQEYIGKYTSVLIGKDITPAIVPDFTTARTRTTGTPNTATLLSGGNIVSIYGDHDNTEWVRKITNLPGVSWEKDHYRGVISFSLLDMLKELGFTFDAKLEERYAAGIAKKNPAGIAKMVDGMPIKPFPYQIDGIKFIEERDGRALIGDEPGLGKTMQALGWLRYRTDVRPALIVCPASLKINWSREAQMWMERPNVCIVGGQKPGQIPHNADVVIINYDVMRYWAPTLKTYKFQAVVLDEVAYIKERSSQRTKAILQFVAQVPHVIALSGTPIVNRPVEFFTTLSAIKKDLFPSYWRFAERYCNLRKTAFGTMATGAKNLEELHRILTRTVMLRRKKEDVLKDLPDKRTAVVAFPLSNREEYMEAQNDFVGWMENQGANLDKINALAKMEKLKQLSVAGKLNACIEWIEEFLDTDKKLVVFTAHNSTMDRLVSHFGNCAVHVRGGMSKDSRQKSVDRFQTDNTVKLFIGNMQAAGVGLTLTAASDCAFLEFPWTPGDFQQCADRVHRIGQKDGVTVWALVGVDSIDENIITQLQKKQKVLDMTLDGKDSDEETSLDELVWSIKRKK